MEITVNVPCFMRVQKLTIPLIPRRRKPWSLPYRRFPAGPGQRQFSWVFFVVFFFFFGGGLFFFFREEWEAGAALSRSSWCFPWHFPFLFCFRWCQAFSSKPLSSLSSARLWIIVCRGSVDFDCLFEEEQEEQEKQTNKQTNKRENSFCREEQEHVS